jgi:signal transduction histidine kinase
MRLYLLRHQPENQEEHLSILEKTASRLKKLVELMLDVSRFQQGTMRLERENVSLQTLAADVVKTQMPEAEARKISVHMDFPAAPLNLLADPIRIFQAITNLVSNAIHYTSEGGTVTVQLATEIHSAQSYGVVRVQDNGGGIAPEHLPKLFQPFYRVTANGRAGTGLGLTITKEIIELHGGTIQVESQLNKGSTFSIQLPLITAASPIEQVVGQKV